MPLELFPAIPSLQDQAIRLIQTARVVAYFQREVVVLPDHPYPVAIPFLQERDALFVSQLTRLHAERLGQPIYRHLLCLPGAFLQPDYRAAWYTARLRELLPGEGAFAPYLLQIAQLSWHRSPPLRRRVPRPTRLSVAPLMMRAPI